jgi:hypothetical protein
VQTLVEQAVELIDMQLVAAVLLDDREQQGLNLHRVVLELAAAVVAQMTH